MEDGNLTTQFEFDYRRARARQRLQLLGFSTTFILLLAVSGGLTGFSLERLAAGLPRIGDYLFLTLPQFGWATFTTDLAYWYYGLWRWLGLLFDTVLIAAMATMMGAVAGLLLSFPAARNLAGHVGIYLLCRRLMDVARSVPEIVFALIFVVDFGVGPLAGILAIAIHSTGALAKLFAETNENIVSEPVDGILATGGNWMQSIRFGVVPQVLPAFVSYGLWRFELNIRSAAIVGFVGAGGIGQELYQAISLSFYEDISAIVIMIVTVVMAIDMLSERIRHRLLTRVAV